MHLEILNLGKQSKKDIFPCVYSCTGCMLLASRPHATQFSQLQRVNCNSLLGLSCLLPNQVDQSLLQRQKALGPFEGQLTCRTGCAPMENGIFSVSQDGVFSFSCLEFLHTLYLYSVLTFLNASAYDQIC